MIDRFLGGKVTVCLSGLPSTVARWRKKPGPYYAARWEKTPPRAILRRRSRSARPGTHARDAPIRSGAGMIGLDTNVVSELLRPAPARQVETWLAARDGATIYFTAAGEAELRHGVAILPAGRRRSGLAEAIDGMMEEDFLNRAAARAYATIAAERRGAGRPISQFDCQIGAIARARNAAVAKRNTVDFEGCGVALLDVRAPGRGLLQMPHRPPRPDPGSHGGAAPVPAAHSGRGAQAPAADRPGGHSS